MITQEKIEIGNKQYQRTKSDTHMLRQVESGNEYREAVDALPCKYTYEETDTPLGDEYDEITDAEALSIIMGGIA